MTLVPTQNVQMTLRGEPNAEFTVVTSRKFKGKNGSYIASLRRLNPGNTTDNSMVNIGTPENNTVINMTVNGVLYGIPSENDEPKVYPINEPHATELKMTMKRLVGARSLRGAGDPSAASWP